MIARYTKNKPAHLVATVLPQHMYGLELGAVMPVHTSASIFTEQTFFSEDIVRALACIPKPRILVTTPFHLRVLLESRCKLPSIAAIVSSTAPLAQSLASDASQRFAAPICELLGATETLVYAWRDRATDALWNPMDGVRIVAGESSHIYRDHLATAIHLMDQIATQGDGRFALLGRSQDVIEVAGKRASLQDLTGHLLHIPGVEDGVILQLPAASERGVARLAAAVVAPKATKKDIVEFLRQRIDPVFIPRRIRFVDILPRTPVGKIARADLLQLFASSAGNQSAR